MKRLYLLFTGLLLTGNVMAQKNPMGLETGMKAPVFNAKDQHGKTVNLQNLLKKGPVVLLFYRGEWCPYCNRQLSQMEDSLSMISAKGATVVAVTPEQMENIDKTIAKTKASYMILHDEQLKIMNDYGVTYMVDKEMDGKLMGYGVDLAAANGTNGKNLPVPAVYIVEKDGTIGYRYFNPDYTQRASVAQILQHL